MKRSELNPLPEYFDRYINKTDDVELLQTIDTSIHELHQLPLAQLKALGDRSYAPGKWSVKDILQHLIDAERIFSYRTLAFARGERQTMPSFSEDEYAITAGANRRTIDSLVAELEVVHKSYRLLYESFTTDMLGRRGKGFKGEYSVAAIGFVMPGHQRWHLQIMEEKYYPLLSR